MSKVHVIAKAAGSMAQIAEGGMMPITKQQIKATPTDSRIAARDFVCDFFQHIDTQENYWMTVARRVMDATPDFRVAVMEEITAQNLMLKEADHPRAASFRTQSSKVNTVCRAFNAGASTEGLLAAYSDKALSIDDMSFNVHVIKYAIAFLESKGQADKRGRKADSFKVALTKFLKQRAESLATDTDKVNHKRTMDFLATLQD